MKYLTVLKLVNMPLFLFNVTFGLKDFLLAIGMRHSIAGGIQVVSHF
jgi:hypothetical protein